MKKIILISILLLMCFLEIKAQEDIGVRLLAKATENSIKLRWAPSDPALWKLSNQYGYQVLRYTILFNGEVQNQPQAKVMNELPLKPFPVEQWEAFTDRSDYAAVAAEAIYGESFEVGADQSNGFFDFINKSKDLENRFAFAVYAAEQSVEVATYAGLYFEDLDVRPNEKYLYKVITLVPQEFIEADTGVFYIGLDDRVALPQVGKIDVEFRDGLAALGWSTEELSDTYSSYFIEKSANGTDFQRITENPVLNNSREELDQREYFIWIDSLQENLKTYYYRVQGVDAFGETGPYSEVVSGNGTPDFYFPVEIGKAQILNNEEVKVEWQFDETGLENLSHFLVTRANSEGGPYEVLQRVESTQRSYLDKNPDYSNYYIIRAVDQFGTEVNSLPYFAQLEDLIPPVKPVGIKGNVDSLGNVTLTWKPNPDKDLLGYRVYRKNFKSDDFVQVTEELIESNSYKEQISTKTLTKDIYYSVRAIDKRFNQSVFSDELKLGKPDLIPPNSPIISDYKVEEDGIFLQWVNSSSNDVIGHLVYRELDGNGEWELVATLPITDPVNNFYRDTENLSSGTRYRYTVIAMDDASLESEPADPIDVKFSGMSEMVVKNWTARVNKEAKHIAIYWQVATEEVSQVEIYKATSEGPLSLYKSVDVGVGVFEDDQVIINQQYRYKLRLVSRDNTSGRFSEEIKVKY